MMLELFSENNDDRKKIIGHSEIKYNNVSSILTKASGFMEGYDYTLNPYSGCTFGCTYCYAAFFSRTEEQRNNWGRWLQVKENAIQLLRKYRKKPLIDKTIYISSVTDPYQPIEKELKIMREILTEFSEFHKPRIVIQTRSPLVTRDIDLFKKFENIQINMTVTTDSEQVRKVFEPFCPSNKMRLDAIKEVHKSGVQVCITMTPLLPIEDPEKFALSLKETGITKFIVQPFHSDKGKFVAGTREAALKLIKELGWTMDKYMQTQSILQKYFPNIGIGKDGFKPI
jgi:DNA repair photolyase